MWLFRYTLKRPRRSGLDGARRDDLVVMAEIRDITALVEATERDDVLANDIAFALAKKVLVRRRPCE